MAGDFTWGIPGIADLVEIGQGTTGVVYRARQLDFGWDVAVKVLTQSTVHPAAVGRFRRELHRMSMLAGHPHIVMTYGWGTTVSDHMYLVMEYMEAGSLADRLRRAGPVDWREAVAMGVKLAGALEDAHQQGVLHLGVKPQNVLVSAQGEPKLSDFGTGWLPRLTLSVTRTIAGFVYSAPEVFEGRSATAACDVYSLAATVFTLIAGRPPFSGDSDEPSSPLIVRVDDEVTPDLRTLGVPDALCEVLERGLAKDPAHRFPTAAALGEALHSTHDPG
ncbi:MAG: serine/threonine-protein kinase [Egibacteraceae bacterium]